MPIVYGIHRDRELVHAKVVGNFTTADVLSCISEVAAEVGERGFNILSDHREIGTPITREQLEMMVARLSTLRATMAGSNWAVVVGKPSSYGMMRMLRVLVERVPIRLEIFECLKEAEAWIASISAIKSESEIAPVG